MYWRKAPKKAPDVYKRQVIKYGLILDPEFWTWCEQNAQKLRSLDPQAVAYAIRRSCELKAQVVGKDERESGLRAILNPVSYTHLDVYKRQACPRPVTAARSAAGRTGRTSCSSCCWRRAPGSR